MFLLIINNFLITAQGDGIYTRLSAQERREGQPAASRVRGSAVAAGGVELCEALCVGQPGGHQRLAIRGSALSGAAAESSAGSRRAPLARMPQPLIPGTKTALCLPQL